MLPDSWGSDMDYAEAMGTHDEPRRTFREVHTDQPPTDEPARELSSDEMTRAVFAALAKVSSHQRSTKGAA